MAALVRRLPLKAEVLLQLATQHVGMLDADTLPDRLKKTEKYYFCCLAVPKHLGWKAKLGTMLSCTRCPQCLAAQRRKTRKEHRDAKALGDLA